MVRGILGNEKNGVLILIQEVQEVFSLIKAQLKLKGTLVIVVKWGASLEYRGCREQILTNESTYIEGATW